MTGTLSRFDVSKVCGSAGVTSTTPTLTTKHPRVHEGTSMADDQSTVEYRDIPGFPGYRVGNDGSVWSCRVNSGRLTDQWRRLRGRMDKRRRISVRLCRDGVVTRLLIHRLVLSVFIGPCPDGMECCHYPDRDPANCTLSNLRWGTKKENMADKISHGTDGRGERNPRAKLKNEQVYEIRRLSAAGETLIGLARRFGVSDSTIQFIVDGETWKHI